jgi:Flp pilus assembly protein TadG
MSDRRQGSNAEGGRRRGAVVRRFTRAEDGSAAVEFAMIAAPFIFLLCAIFELAIMFLAGQLLDSATNDTARLIRTGQASTTVPSASSFATQVCSRLYVLFDCTQLAVESKTYANFSTIGDLSSTAAYTDTSGNFDATKVTSYQTGGGSCIVVVRVFYPYPVFFKSLLWDATSAPSGKVMMVGVAAFRNEPFPGGGSC